MNEQMKIRNALNNYYAIARIELEKYQNQIDSPEYQLNFYAENLLKGILNNDFSLVLYDYAIKVINNLELVNQNKVATYQEIKDHLSDSLVIFDVKLLRAYDPIDYLMKTIMEYVNFYYNYERPTDEEVTKHRYDVILKEVCDNETFGSILIKMFISLANRISEIVVEIKKIHKDNVLADSLISIKNLFHNMGLCLLFKQDDSIHLCIRYLLDYLLPLIALYTLPITNEERINRLNIYADYHFSLLHSLPLPKGGMVDMQFFDRNNGFIADESGVIPTNLSLLQYYGSARLAAFYVKDSINTNTTLLTNDLFVLFMKFIDSITAVYEDSSVIQVASPKIKQVIEDLQLLLKEIKEQK